jgi:spore coat polysaccharide biosynthesis protein SpsF
MDVEVFDFDSLEQAWREDQNPAWREHVTPFLYRRPDLFTIHGVHNDVDYSMMRWTVDTPEDRDFVLRVYNHFGHDRFTWQDVLAVLERHPDWLDINRHVEQKIC